MMIRALELEDILKLMATDIDNDYAYIRIEHGIGRTKDDRRDEGEPHKALYIGPFSIYEPYY